MQSILSKQFLQQYSLLNSENRQVSAKANKYILQAIEHPQILEHAMQMALTKKNSVRLQMLGAHLIYVKMENDCNKMQLEQFLRLKLIDSQYEKGAENFLCSIMGVLVIILYPQHWCNFVDEMVDFMRSDINRFNYGLTILLRAATELHNQSIARSVRLKAMKAFHQQYSQLLSVFQFLIELNNQDINSKLIGILQEWSNANLPLLKSPMIVDFVLKQVMSQSSIIRLGTLPTIKNALKHAFFGKKQNVCLSLNFYQSGLASEQMQSLNKITEFLIKENIWFYQSLQLHQEDQDIQNYVQILSTLLFSYSFLLFTPIGESLIQIPLFLFRSSFKKISHSTFNLWPSFFNFMQNHKKQAKQLHIDKLASQMLQVLLKKVALTKQQILQQVNQNDQTRNFGQIGFFQYRDAATSVFKAIHDFYLEYRQNKETGAQFFFQTIMKNLEGIQKSICIQLIFLIIQSCFGRGLDEIDYQSLKVLQILKNVFQFCEEQKERIHELAVIRLLTTVRDYRFQISQNPELYLLALKFTVPYLTSENIGHNAVLSFDKLIQFTKQEIRKNVIQEVLQLYLKNDFSSLGIKQKILSAIMKLISKNENHQLKSLVFQQIIKNIQNNIQTIHTVYQLESLPNAQPYLNTITQISILCQNLSQIHVYSEFISFHKKSAKLSEKIMNETLEYGLKYSQSLQDYTILVKCTQKFEQIVRCSTDTIVFQIFPQILAQLLEKVFSLFQIKNLNLLLDHGKLVIVAAKLLKIISFKANEKINLWLKQNVLRINGFFFQYYELKCTPDFKEADPDIIRAYFTLEEAFCIFNYQIFLEQIPQTILQFSVLCLEKIVQKKIHRQILSFILNILQKRQICQTQHQVGSWLAINLISLSSIMDSPSQNLLAKILIYVFVNIIRNSDTSIVSKAMESPNFQFLNAEMKSTIAYYLTLFATRQSLTYTKAILSHFNQLKFSEKEDEQYAKSFLLIYQKWSKKIESNSYSPEERVGVQSDD